MARPLRLEFPGALYHLTARGNRREPVYLDAEDYRIFIDLLGKICCRFGWRCHAYCLMGNHYHLVIETPQGGLSRGMGQLNGRYTQLSNRRHGRVGHVFQGRYRAILVQKQAYLLELSRHVVLNPVRIDMVGRPEAWPWSSYRATVGEAAVPKWLETHWLLSQFGGDRLQAKRRYRRYALADEGGASIWQALTDQIYLGDRAFVAQAKQRIEPGRPLRDVPRIQCRPRPPLEEFLPRYGTREQAMALAYLEGGYSQPEIAAHYGVHCSTVSRALRAFEKVQQVLATVRD